MISDYWDDFPLAAAKGWNDPTFFPIGVWYQDANDAAAFVSYGINTMVVVINDGLSDLEDVGDATGMVFICQPEEWTEGELGSNPYVVGHVAGDEVDMNEEPNAIPVLTAIVDDLRDRADGRFVYANFGKGSMGTFWSAADMPELVQMVDVCSDDVYWFTDPWMDPAEPAMDEIPTELVREAANYGWTVDQMLSFDNHTPAHPYWHFVELGHPFTDGEFPAYDAISGNIALDDIEGAVWHSIVHGANGIVYFNHSFGGALSTNNVLEDDDPDIATTVTAINARLTGLATVLNTVSTTFDAGADVSSMLKVSGTDQYLFVVTEMDTTSGSRTINVPITSGDVTVVGESRTLTASGGTITDTFASTNVMHVYLMSDVPPPEGTILMEDDWTGTNGDGWDPVLWPTQRDISAGVDPGVLDIQSNMGHIESNGTSRLAAFSADSFDDFDLTVRIIADLAGSLYPEIGFRIVANVLFADPTGYALQFSSSSGGSATLNRIGAYTGIGSVTGIGTTIDKTVRIQALGSAIKVKVWDYGDTEPGTWDIEVTDSTYTFGPIFLSTYAFGAGLEVSFDELLVLGEAEEPPPDPEPGVQLLTGTATDTMGADDTDTETIDTITAADPRVVTRSLFENRIMWGSPSDTTPRGPTFSDTTLEPFTVRAAPPNPMTVSVIFRVKQPVRFTGCRVYKAPNATGDPEFALWESSTLSTSPSSTGTLLGTATDGTWVVDGGGWRQITFASPIDLDVDTSYVLGFYSPDGIYAYTTWVWNAQDNVVWPLEVKGLFEASGVRSDGAANTSTGTLPETGATFPLNHIATNYYIDPQVEWDEVLPGFDGGTDYYDQWTNPDLPTRYGFPIAVFFADPEFLEEYYAMGVKMLMAGSPHTGNGPDYLAVMADMGYTMDWWPYLDGGSLTSTFSPSAELVQLQTDEPLLGDAIRGYLIDDEPDLVGPYRSPDLLRGWANNMRRRDSTKPLYLGFGRFLSRNQGYYGLPSGGSIQTLNELWRQWAAIADVIGLDDYSWYDDNNASGNLGVWPYAAQIGRLREVSDDSKPVWGIVETCARVAGAPVPEDVRKAIWASLIAGARGIILFDHRFGNDFVTQDLAAMLHDAPMKAMMTTLITRIQSLSTALLGEDLGLVTAYTSSNTTAGPLGGTYGTPIHYTSRTDGTYEYVFAQAIRPGATTATLTIPSWASEVVDVLDEARTETLDGSGILTDTFAADYTTHLYRRTL